MRRLVNRVSDQAANEAAASAINAIRQSISAAERARLALQRVAQAFPLRHFYSLELTGLEFCIAGQGLGEVYTTPSTKGFSAIFTQVLAPPSLPMAHEENTLRIYPRIPVLPNGSTIEQPYRRRIAIGLGSEVFRERRIHEINAAQANELILAGQALHPDQLRQQQG